ncbi:MAG: hypothetical protein JWN96_1811, partial [Mycobacterium sp.]|nr:hypothetical protein [Mycobacterium sp.]
MRRLTILCASAAAAAVPAVFGLAGNPSFSQTVPVQVPAQVKTASTHSSPATPAARDDHGKHAEPGDDRGTDAARSPSPSPSPTRSPAAIPGVTPVAPRIDDHGVHAEPGDDRGVQAEPGDDRGVNVEPGDGRGVQAEPGDDHP